MPGPLWFTFCRLADQHPRRVVVTDAETSKTWTLAELRDAAHARAPQLREGIFCLPNGGAWFVEFLACQHAGIPAVPLDPTLPTDAQSNIRALLTGKRPRAACIKLTSGTTNGYTPIPCTTAHLLADARQVCATMRIRPRDVNLALIPLGHSYGLGNLVIPLLQQGTPVVCASAFVPRQVLEIIERYRVTVFPTVPAVLRALAALPNVQRPASLRLVISAGAPLSAEIAQAFRQRFGLTPHNFYGSSETGGICYDRTGKAALTGRGIGKPLDGVRVTLQRDGRVVVKSPAVVGSGRQVLPDRAEWNRYGELRLLGRVGLVANIGGKKIAPASVEAELRQVTGVTDAWVTVFQNPRGDDFLAAAVETTRPGSEIEHELARRLAAWQLPKRYHVSLALPRTARGKLDTTELCRLLAH